MKKIIAILVALCLCFGLCACDATRYNEAMEQFNIGKYEIAKQLFEELGDYEDSADKLIECEYNLAIKLMNNGQIVEAYEALIALNGYRDSAEKAASLYEKYKLLTAKIGDCVKLGIFEQDYEDTTTEEPIEWIVLDVVDKKALLISKYSLFYSPYHQNKENITWEACTLRKTLNSTFMDLAFSEDEAKMILTTTVPADINPDYDTDPGNETQDKVFLLSIAEANRYFTSDNERSGMATKFAFMNAKIPGSSPERWWLRTPGLKENKATFVLSDGTIHESGEDVDNELFFASSYSGIYVRPALWIDLSA